MDKFEKGMLQHYTRQAFHKNSCPLFPEHELTVQMAKLAMSPSAAKMPNLIDQQKKYPILNGRPASSSIILFLAFEEAMYSADTSPDADDYAITHALFTTSAALYMREKKLSCPS
jgi:hypothetical protein